MKIKNIFMALGGALLMTCSMASCSDDEKYDFDGIAYDRIYFNNATSLAEGSVVKTPVGNFTALDGEKAIKVTAKTTKDIHVKFAIDNSLVGEYNDKNKTEYEAAPDGVFSLSTDQLTIEADTTASKETLKLAISDANIEKLESGKSYLVPVTITGSDDSNFRASSNVGVAYYLVSVSTKLIKDDGTLDGLTKITEKSTWRVTCNDSGAGNLQNIVDGNESTTASFSQSSDLVITVDFGGEVEFSAVQAYFSRYYYGFNDVTFEYSTDGSTWQGIGTVSGGYSNPNPAAVLYGAIKAKYVRVSGTFMYTWSSYYWKFYELNLYK